MRRWARVGDRELGQNVKKGSGYPVIFAVPSQGARGNTDSAFRWLERAYSVRDPWLVLVAVNWKLDTLRTDSRFQTLSQRMQLPK